MWRLAGLLPRTSRYQAARHNDDEVAARTLALMGENDEKSSPHPDLVEWSPEVELLTLIVESLNHLRADFAAVNSKNHKRPKVPELPRPQTAFERVKAKSVRTQHKWISKQVLSKEG